MKYFFGGLIFCIFGLAEAFAGELRLEGILFEASAPETSVAVLNGNFYKKGDEIENYRIVEISPETVKVLDNASGQETELKLFEGTDRIGGMQDGLEPPAPLAPPEPPTLWEKISSALEGWLRKK